MKTLCQNCGIVTVLNGRCATCGIVVKDSRKIAEEIQAIALCGTYESMLELSYQRKRHEYNSMGMSMTRKEYLASFLFEYVSVDTEMLERCAHLTLVVAKAINDDATQPFFMRNEKWFETMTETSFFSGRLQKVVKFDGGATAAVFWKFEDHCILGMKLTYKKWKIFIRAMINFSLNG